MRELESKEREDEAMEEFISFIAQWQSPLYRSAFLKSAYKTIEQRPGRRKVASSLKLSTTVHPSYYYDHYFCACLWTD